MDTLRALPQRVAPVRKTMIGLLRSNAARPGALTLAFLVLVASAVRAPGETVLPARVQVTWAPADQLSEVRENPMQRGLLRPEDWMKTLGEHLRTRADQVLPPGQQLLVTITDITLAGAFEPWHSPDLDDVRYMKDIYPPRLKLHYKLMASDGSLLREGDARLVDPSYLHRTGLPADTDPLRYDKRQIDDWLKREFRKR
jgi:hypothetical protein